MYKAIVPLCCILFAQPVLSGQHEQSVEQQPHVQFDEFLEKFPKGDELIDFRDELFGLSPTHVFVIRYALIRNEAMWRMSSSGLYRGHTQMVLVAIDINTGEETLWELNRLIMHDRGYPRHPEKSDLDALANPFKILAEYGGFPVDMAISTYPRLTSSHDTELGPFNDLVSIKSIHPYPYQMTLDQMRSVAARSWDNTAKLIFSSDGLPDIPYYDRTFDSNENKMVSLSGDLSDDCILKDAKIYTEFDPADPIILAQVACKSAGSYLDWFSMYFILQENTE